MQLLIDAVGLPVKNLVVSTEFYTLLGFVFPSFESNENHIETSDTKGVRLTLDTEELLLQLGHPTIIRGNTANFGLRCANAEELNQVFAKIHILYPQTQQPFDAVWGQRFVTIQDPDGNRIDLFASL